ncbi:MAG: thioesterase II family protein, partial [Pseudonocardiaceae bacterium]
VLGQSVLRPFRGRAQSAGEPLSRLVCFPHAGGTASAFNAWGALFPREVEVLAVQLPGREGRYREPVPTDLDALIAELTAAVAAQGGVPTVFFGHSWGAILAFEVSLRLLHTTSWSVDHLVVAGSVAPHVPMRMARLSHLPRAEFLTGITRLGGIPPVILAHEECLDLVIPALRADLRLAESYAPRPRRQLPCPITVFAGTGDPLTPVPALDAWGEYTSAGFRRVMFEGDHFFVQSAHRQVAAAVAAIMSSRNAM